MMMLKQTHRITPSRDRIPSNGSRFHTPGSHGLELLRVEYLTWSLCVGSVDGLCVIVWDVGLYTQ